MDPLARLFGSPARVKLLRLFFFNDDMAFSATEIAFRTRVAKTLVRKELATLTAADVIRKRATKGNSGYAVNKRFEHYEPLLAFLRTTTNLSDTHIITLLKRAGSLRLVVLSGLFTGAIETRVDLLVVGDRLDDKQLAAAVHIIEAELGRELRFASFSTEDFRYRLGVYDRLIRDVFDYPRRFILDKLGVSPS